MTHHMKLNPTKEMHVNFLHNVNFLIRNIITSGYGIECVNTYKILEVIIDKDLK